MSVVRRIASGTVANTAGIGFTAILQVLSVPVLTAAWGVEQYGVWLMLTTIPTYFALSDLGFATAATSDMTMQVARGAREQALCTFQSLWLLVLAVGMAAIALASMLFLVSGEAAGGTLAWVAAHADLLFLLVTYSTLTLSSRINLAAFRATGNYAGGTLAFDGLVLGEGLLVLTIAWSGGDYRACVLAQIGVRALNWALLSYWLRASVPWLRFGVAHASRAELRRLLAPALAAMAVPTALALNLQGMVLVVGAALSPAAAAILVSVRTASRLVIQIIGALNRATMPELSGAVARGDRGAVSAIVSINLVSVALFLLPGAIAFAFFGPWLVSLWTRGHVVPGGTFVALMALAMMLHGLWYFAANLLLATNRHVEFGGFLLGVAVVTVLLAVPAAHIAGLNGIAAVTVLGELVAAVRAIYLLVRRDMLQIRVLIDRLRHPRTTVRVTGALR